MRCAANARTASVAFLTVVCVALVSAASCRAVLNVPPTATIACNANGDCPADRACIDGTCLAASLDCVVDVGGGTLGAAEDGTDCGEAPNGVCVRGQCFTRG